MEMKLSHQAILVNIGILAGLILGYYDGAPMLSLLLAAGLLLMLANTIFFLRWKKRK
jgi:hypothetical protein